MSAHDRSYKIQPGGRRFVICLLRLQEDGPVRGEVSRRTPDLYPRPGCPASTPVRDGHRPGARTRRHDGGGVVGTPCLPSQCRPFSAPHLWFRPSSHRPEGLFTTSWGPVDVNDMGETLVNILEYRVETSDLQGLLVPYHLSQRPLMGQGPKIYRGRGTHRSLLPTPVPRETSGKTFP